MSATPEATAASTPVAVVTRIIDHVPPGKHEVALTFDAGAGTGRVADILATLRQYQVHITFFLTGQWAEQNPDMARLITADGNEVGNHSYDHPYFSKLSDAQMIDELAHANQIIQQTTGAEARYWRPPFGDYTRHVIDVAIAQGYQPMLWTLDSLDSVGQPKTKQFILDRVTNNNIEMDGAIILQHMAADASADALPQEIERLEARGLKIVTLSELLSASPDRQHGCADRTIAAIAGEYEYVVSLRRLRNDAVIAPPPLARSLTSSYEVTKPLSARLRPSLRFLAQSTL